MFSIRDLRKVGLAQIKSERGDTFFIKGLSPDGRLLAVYREHFKRLGSFKIDSSIQLHDTRTGELRVTLTGSNMMWSAHQVAWSPDSQTLVTAGGSHGYEGKIWDVATGQLRADLSLIVKEVHVPFTRGFNDLDRLSFHPSSPVVIGESQKLIKFWDPATGRLLQEIASADLQRSRDSNLMATITPGYNAIQIWEFVKR